MGAMWKVGEEGDYPSSVHAMVLESAEGTSSPSRLVATGYLTYNQWSGSLFWKEGSATEGTDQDHAPPLYFPEGLTTLTALSASDPSRYLVSTIAGTIHCIQRSECTLDEIQSTSAHDSPILSLDYQSESQKVISSSQDGVIKIWEVEETGALRECAVAYQQRRAVTQVSWRPGSSQFISVGEDAHIHLWDASTNGAPVATTTQRMASLSVSWKDSHWFACGREDGCVQVMDIRQLDQVVWESTTPWHKDAIHAVEWAASSPYLASGGDDGYVCISQWDETTTTLERTFQSEPGPAFVRSLRWHSGPDGRESVWAGDWHGHVQQYTLQAE